MSNLFKEGLKFMTLKAERTSSPLYGEKLPENVIVDEKVIGKYGVLANEKFEREEGEER